MAKRPTAHAQASADEVRTDKQLVYAARDGDMRSFDALFYRHRDGIFRLGLAITKDPSAAEEIVVDTFARAHRALARLEPEDSLRPWLYRVAVNLSYNRAPRKGVVLSPLEDAIDEAVSNDERSPAKLFSLSAAISIFVPSRSTIRAALALPVRRAVMRTLVPESVAISPLSSSVLAGMPVKAGNVRLRSMRLTYGRSTTSSL